MILLKTPLLPDGKGQTNDADASEKFVCPNVVSFLREVTRDLEATPLLAPHRN
jgi:hypothetical protein